MARRFLLCDVIGTGTRADPYRPVVADLPVTFMALIPTDAAGRPARSWCFVLASATDLSAAVGKTGVDPFPNALLDDTIGSIPAATRQAIQDALTRRGATIPQVTLATMFRVFVRNVGRQLEAAFAETAFETLG